MILEFDPQKVMATCAVITLLFGIWRYTQSGPASSWTLGSLQLLVVMTVIVLMSGFISTWQMSKVSEFSASMVAYAVNLTDKKYGAALIDAKHARDLFPDNVVAWKSVAIATTKFEGEDKGRAVHEEILKLFPNDKDAIYNVAYSLYADAYNKLKDDEPDHGAAIERLRESVSHLETIVDIETPGTDRAGSEAYAQQLGISSLLLWVNTPASPTAKALEKTILIVFGRLAASNDKHTAVWAAYNLCCLKSQLIQRAAEPNLAMKECEQAVELFRKNAERYRDSLLPSSPLIEFGEKIGDGKDTAPSDTDLLPLYDTKRGKALLRIMLPYTPPSKH